MTEDIVERLVITTDCKQGAVRAVRFNGDGNYCLSCGSDKSLKLWNPYQQTLLKTYHGHGYEVLDAQASCDNSQICSAGGMDKTIILWDVSSGKMVRKYRGHAGRVNCVSFNEEGTVIFSGSVDNSIRAWDCRSRKMDPIQIMDEAKDSVTCIDVTDYEVMTGSADGRMRRYDIRSGQLIADFIGKPVTSVGFTQDGQCMLASTLDNTIRMFDKQTGELLNEYTGHKNTEYKIDSCISSSDRQVISGSEDGKVYVWDLVQAKVIRTLEHKSKGIVHSLSFHPKDCCLVTACENKIYIWK